MITLRASWCAFSLSAFVVCLIMWPIPAVADNGPPEYEQVDLSEHVSAGVSSVTAVGGAWRRRRGRPRKFNEPSRAVTLTLPEGVLKQLAGINGDLSRAVAEVVARRPSASPAAPNGHRAAELAVFGNHAVITIKPTRALERRAGVNLVPLPDGRALISFDQATTISDLELILYDALDDPTLAAEDREVFEGIAAILTESRRANDVRLLHRTIIVLQSSRHTRDTAATPRPTAAAKRGPGQRRKTP